LFTLYDSISKICNFQSLCEQVEYQLQQENDGVKPVDIIKLTLLEELSEKLSENESFFDFEIEEKQQNSNWKQIHDSLSKIQENFEFTKTCCSNIQLSAVEFVILAKPFTKSFTKIKFEEVVAFLAVKAKCPVIALDASENDLIDSYGKTLDRIEQYFSDKPGMTRYIDPAIVFCEELAATPVNGLPASIALIPVMYQATQLPDLGGGNWNNVLQVPGGSQHGSVVAACLSMRHSRSGAGPGVPCRIISISTKRCGNYHALKIKSAYA
jgi:hypothetical protein